MIGSLDLRLTPLWTGAISPSWKPATAYLMDTVNETTSVPIAAESYSFLLTDASPPAAGASNNASSVNIDYPFTTLNNVTRRRARGVDVAASAISSAANGSTGVLFDGIRMDVAYAGSLTCNFAGGVSVTCGQIMTRTRELSACCRVVGHWRFCLR
jgi:hypothetical protein